MIKSYKYHISCHIMLHSHVMAFFDRIEFETGSFDDDFFDDDFKDIVKRHPEVLEKRCKDIFEEFKILSQLERTNLCEIIRKSNDIENICCGKYVPPTYDNKVKGVYKKLRVLFLSLYKQVLDGDGFKDKYNTTLRDHFNGFCNLNKEITLCPICGIGELKKADDDFRDQYDHFLPKGLYPFSSVNFANLVPSCTECNSFNAKGEKDTIAVSTGVLFYPFDENHNGISIKCEIKEETVDSCEWTIKYANPDGNDDKITSWRTLYNIDSRYIGYIKARIEKWYSSYWKYINSPKTQERTIDKRIEDYYDFLDLDNDLGLSFIRKAALNAFIDDSIISQAAIEAKLYS